MKRFVVISLPCMVVATLKNILVSEIAEDGLPLFSNSVKLAEAVAENSPNAYKNPKTTAALLNFVFRCERNCSDSLRDALIKAVRARLVRQPRRVQDDWVQRVGRAIDALGSEVAKAQQTRAESDEDQFDNLLQHAESAGKHFIITPLTAEQEKGIKRAEELNHKLLKHLGIYPKNEADPKTEYWFLLPNLRTGEKFWEKLREKALLALDATGESDWADTRLKTLDEHGYIRVFIVPSFVCGCPIVIYDPDNTRDSAGFSFSHHRDNVIDAIRWDGVSISQWKENVFEAFKWENPKTKKAFTEPEAIEFMRSNPTYFAGYRCTVPSKPNK